MTPVCSYNSLLMAHLLALAGRRIGVLAWLQVLSALDYLTEVPEGDQV